MTELSTPLPSPQSLLAAFRDGAVPPNAPSREILRLAVQLVEAHRWCRAAQDRVRAYVEAPHDQGDRWAVTTAQWLHSLEEIDSLVLEIDEAVRRRWSPITGEHPQPGHVVTDTAGHLISRMAGLWVPVETDDPDHEPIEETRALWQLCQGYESLIEGLAHGAVQQPPMWSWPPSAAAGDHASARSRRTRLDAVIAALAEGASCEVLLREDTSAVLTLSGPRPSHGLHAALTVAVRGVWLPVWLARIYISRPERWRIAVSETGQIHSTPLDSATYRATDKFAGLIESATHATPSAVHGN